MYPTKKLGDICDILDNKRKPVTQSDRIPGPYPYYGATGILDYVSEYIFDEKLILIGEDGAKWGSGENTAFTAEGKYWVNNHAHVIRPHRDIVCDDWIIYFLNITDLLEHVTGVTVPKLNQGKLREIQIPLPPLSTQLDIVARLDSAIAEIDSLRAETESALANTRELWEATLESVFASGGNDWDEKRLGDTYDIRDGTHDSPKYQPTGYPLITSKNLRPEGLSFDNIKLISETDYQKINERSKVHKGDILFAMIGTIGAPTIVEIEPEFAIKNVALFKVPETQNNRFLKYYLSSRFVVQKMMSESKGSTQKFVGLGYLRDFRINLPSLSEQSRIVTHLDAVRAETERLEQLYTEKLASLDELRRSVLAEAFL